MIVENKQPITYPFDTNLIFKWPKLMMLTPDIVVEGIIAETGRTEARIDDITAWSRLAYLVI